MMQGEWDWMGRPNLPQNRPQGQPQGGLFSQAMTALGQYGQNAQADLDQRHMEAVFAANPEYAAKIYGAPTSQYQKKTLDMALREEQRQLEQRGALAKIAEQIGGGVPTNGQMGPMQVSPGESALAQMAAVTGDPSQLAALLVAREKAAADANSPDAGGATGVLVNRLMAENPKLSFNDALFQVQTGYRKGVNMADNVATPITGLGPALGSLGRDENFGKEAGTLDAQGLLKPQVEADIATAKSDATYMAEGRQKLPYAQRALQSAVDRNAFLDDKMASLETRANGLTTGWTGNLMSAVAGTEAFDLKADVDTLLANAGFDRLQEMRDSSPTGGALGAVSERELGLLQSAAQSLLQSQSKDQFLKNLALFKEQRTRGLENMRKAYEQDYQRFGGSGDVNLPAPASTLAPAGVGSTPNTGTRKRWNPATQRLE